MAKNGLMTVLWFNEFMVLCPKLIFLLKNLAIIPQKFVIPKLNAKKFKKIDSKRASAHVSFRNHIA